MSKVLFLTKKFEERFGGMNNSATLSLSLSLVGETNTKQFSNLAHARKYNKGIRNPQRLLWAFVDFFVPIHSTTSQFYINTVTAHVGRLSINTIMEKENTYPKGTVIWVKDGSRIRKARILATVNSPDILYLTVRYMDGASLEEHYGCIKQSQIVQTEGNE